MREVYPFGPDFVDGRSLQEVPFLPKEGGRLPLSLITIDPFSAIQAPREVLIRGEAAFAALWAEHNAGRDRSRRCRGSTSRTRW